jgi:hypothetical protein
MTKNAPPLDVIVITAHAVDRYTQRARLDRNQYNGIVAMIEREVRDAVAANRMADRIPKAFRLYGRRTKGGHMAPNETFVWNADVSIGWVVRHWPDRDVVTTTMVATKGA